jgi:hypothetical protein
MRSFLFLSLLVAGCSSPKIWYNPDHTANETLRDFGACRMHAANAPVVTGENMNGIGVYMSTQIAQGNFLQACMESKGYVIVPAKTVTNGAAYPRAH